MAVAVQLALWCALLHRRWTGCFECLVEESERLRRVCILLAGVPLTSSFWDFWDELVDDKRRGDDKRTGDTEYEDRSLDPSLGQVTFGSEEPTENAMQGPPVDIQFQGAAAGPSQQHAPVQHGPGELLMLFAGPL